MSPFRFLIYALATWRIANMLVAEDGPSHLIFRLRHRLGVRCLDRECRDRYADPPDGFLPSLFLCVWCMGVWVAGAWMLAATLWRKGANIAATLSALSAVACLLDGVMQKLED
jgi:hypothetical protein